MSSTVLRTIYLLPNLPGYILNQSISQSISHLSNLSIYIYIFPTLESSYCHYHPHFTDEKLSQIEFMKLDQGHKAGK